jgi:putative CocE/NonD family hydrolase
MPPARQEPDYVKRNLEIPMRDGVLLHTVILIPKGVNHAPMLLDRSPYSQNEVMSGGEAPFLSQSLAPLFAELAERGYIIVVQDVRGKYGSGGEYVMNRPVRGPLNSTGIDNATDTWDTIDWLVKHVPESNGRVGTIGTSYEGFTVLMSLIDPHPALKAAVPMNPMVDGWRGDDWFHNGAFREEMMSYIYDQTASKRSDETWSTPRYDDYDAFLHYRSAGAYGAAMGMDQLPFWRRLTQHPAYDDFWQEQAVDKTLAQKPLTVPTLLVDGQWDQEDIYGAPAVWRALSEHAGDKLHLVMGPWLHGQESYDASSLGALEWGSDTAKWFRTEVLIPFLDANLKEGTPVSTLPPVTVFESGTNRWRQLPKWPPATRQVSLNLGADGTLALGQSAQVGSGYDEYVSDPSKPVTYRPRPNRPMYAKGSTWRYWLVDDQRFAASRPDVLTYTSEVLTAPVHIAGRPIADLFASTSGTDSDWIVKLIDVYPEFVPEKPSMSGYELAVSMDIPRGRYRDDPSRPTAISPGKVIQYRLNLPDTDHVFLPGHRIMVQVQSSWFPLYDRNPQTFVPNIFYAQPEDYRKATQRIYHRAGQASAIELPIVP